MHDVSSEPDPGVLACVSFMEKVLPIAVMVIGAGVLTLWIFPQAAVFAPAGWSQMTAVTAVGMLLAASSLLLLQPPESIASAHAGTVAAVAVASLGAAVLIVDLSEVSGLGGVADHLPSPQTALGFVLTGVALLLSNQRKDGWWRLADTCSVVFVVLLLFLLGRYVFNAIGLVGIGESRQMSPHTLLSFFSIAAVVAARRAASPGYLSVLGNGGFGSRMTRCVLPFVVAAPFAVLGLVRYLGDARILAEADANAIAAPLTAVVVLGVVMWMARPINRLERALRRQSITDPLTGVLNRRGFETVANHALHRAARAGTSLFTLYFDLDDLKRINDTLGHDAGSEVVERFASLLVGSFRRDDVIARVGGDEFVVLAAGDRRAARSMLEKLSRKIDRANAAAAVLPGAISYSVGCAYVRPDARTQLEDFVTRADLMMHEHKMRKKAGEPVDRFECLGLIEVAQPEPLRKSA